MKCVYLIVLLLPFTYSEFQVVGPSDPLIALAGSDLVLPCSMLPSISTVDMYIDWIRLEPTYSLVHVYKDRKDQNEDQDPQYRERTSLFKEELQKGNASLLLAKVRVSDEGKYKCSIRGKSWDDDHTVQVRVEAIGTHPLVTVESYDNSGGVSLLCESKGWWPKPDLQWLDSEGNNLTKVPEMHEGTESLSVKHRITVHDSDSKFHCRVKQRDHMLETEIIISNQMFRAWKIAVAWIVITVLAVAGLIVFFIWRERRQEQNELERERRQEQNELERVQEVQTYLSRRGLGRLREVKLTPAQWSVVVYVLLNSKEVLDEFDLRKYDPSEECLLKLLPVVKLSKKVLLSDCNIKGEGCAFLFNALKSNNSSHLRELNLSSNNPGESGVNMLCDVLKNTQCNLEKLKLFGFRITGEGCAALFNALKSNSSSRLRELDLSYNALGEDELSDLLGDPHCKLEILQLSNCSITGESCAALFNALKSNPSSHLRELDLSYNEPGKSVKKELSDLLGDPHCKLEKLELLCCNITNEGCAALFNALKSNPSSHLRELNLNYNNPGESVKKELSDLLGEPHCKLEKLELLHCSITGEDCAALFNALKSNPSSHLRELNLICNEPGESVKKELSDLLRNPHCKLEKLELSNCSITGEGCASLFNALKSNPSSHLRELDLNYNNAEESVKKELSDLLRDPHCNLEILQLPECRIEGEDCAALFNALKSNPSSHLRELNLNYNNAEGSVKKELSDLLRDPHCNLEILQLSHCNIIGEDCAALASALKSNPSSHLRELNLSYNGPGESVKKELSDLLRDPHCKLEKLQLSHCNITNEGCAALASALKSNPSSHLRELNLSYNEPGESVKKELSDLLGEPHCKLEKLHICCYTPREDKKS